LLCSTIVSFVLYSFSSARQGLKTRILRLSSKFFSGPPVTRNKPQLPCFETTDAESMGYAGDSNLLHLELILRLAIHRSRGGRNPFRRIRDPSFPPKQEAASRPQTPTTKTSFSGQRTTLFFGPRPSNREVWNHSRIAPPIQEQNPPTCTFFHMQNTAAIKHCNKRTYKPAPRQHRQEPMQIRP